jgi:hypothetical protein
MINRHRALPRIECCYQLRGLAFGKETQQVEAFVFCSLNRLQDTVRQHVVLVLVFALAALQRGDLMLQLANTAFWPAYTHQQYSEPQTLRLQTAAALIPSSAASCLACAT